MYAGEAKKGEKLRTYYAHVPYSSCFFRNPQQRGPDLKLTHRLWRLWEPNWRCDILKWIVDFLFKVMEILQTSNSTELFAPELEDERKLKTADPVTNDLLGALLSVSPLLSHCYVIYLQAIYHTGLGLLLPYIYFYTSGFFHRFLLNSRRCKLKFFFLNSRMFAKLEKISQLNSNNPANGEYTQN